jgi:hypothetical protein
MSGNGQDKQNQPNVKSKMDRIYMINRIKPIFDGGK